MLADNGFIVIEISAKSRLMYRIQLSESGMKLGKLCSEAREIVKSYL